MERLVNRNIVMDKKGIILRLALVANFSGADYTPPPSPTLEARERPVGLMSTNNISGSAESYLFKANNASEALDKSTLETSQDLGSARPHPIEKISTQLPVTDNSPGKEIIDVFSVSSSEGLSINAAKEETNKQKKIRYDKEEKEILKIITSPEHKKSFSKKYIRDLKIYYPFYKAIAEKFHIDWFLIWIVHEKETGASAGDRGFVKGRQFYGAMQRNLRVWSEAFVMNASKGLSWLKALPARRRDDWRELAAGAKILDRNYDHYTKKGASKVRATWNTLRLYSADKHAKQRLNIWKKWRKFLPSSIVLKEAVAKNNSIKELVSTKKGNNVFEIVDFKKLKDKEVSVSPDEFLLVV